MAWRCSALFFLFADCTKNSTGVLGDNSVRFNVSALSLQIAEKSKNKNLISMTRRERRLSPWHEKTRKVFVVMAV